MASKKTAKPDAAESAVTVQQQLPLAAPATPEKLAAAIPAMVATAATEDNALALVNATPADRHAALIDGWLADKNAAAIASVAREDSAPASARKAARRAIGILKARGIVVPEKAHVAQLRARPSVVIEARMTFPDSDGSQMWWITRTAATGGVDFAEVTTVDRGGITNFQRASTSAGALRQHFQGWQTRAGRAPTEVPLGYARARLSDAKRLSVARKQVLPMGIDFLSTLLGDLEQVTPVAHPIDEAALAIPRDEEVVKARLASSSLLHSEPELAPWLPDQQAGMALLTTINERVVALGAPGDGKPEEIDAAVRVAIDEATDAYFDATRKHLFGIRIRDAAWSLWKADRTPQAIDAMLVADALSKAGIVSDRPSEIPFVRTIFVKLIAIAQQRARQQAAAQQAQQARQANV